MGNKPINEYRPGQFIHYKDELNWEHWMFDYTKANLSNGLIPTDDEMLLINIIVDNNWEAVHGPISPILKKNEILTKSLYYDMLYALKKVIDRIFEKKNIRPITHTMTMISELDPYTMDHVSDQIKNGYSQGDLYISIPGSDEVLDGWWGLKRPEVKQDGVVCDYDYLVFIVDDMDRLVAEYNKLQEK